MDVRPGIDVAALSDVGCQRENNEDSYRYWESPDDSVFARLGRLLIVADGMGGHEGGQIASHIAVETMERAYSESPNGDPQSALINAVREAHRCIQEKARESVFLLGMGTTCTACAIVGPNLYYAHVGDSRLYHLRKGSLRLLSRDHSLVARLLETGIIRQQDAENHPQRHVLTAALGVANEVEPDVSTQPLALEASDVILVCTDGLWGQFSDDELRDVLSTQQPKDACQSLVRMAKERGGPDNITLQIARVA